MFKKLNYANLMRFVSNYKISGTTYALIGLIAIVFLVVSHWNGPGLTYDSYDYINISKNLKSFFSKQPIEGKIIVRPPLYPVLLYFSSHLGQIGFSLLHIIFFIINAYLFYLIINKSTNNKYLSLVSFTLFAFGIPVHLIHSFLWTESLVMILVLLQTWLILDSKKFFSFITILFVGIVSIFTKNGALLLIPGFMSFFFLILIGRKRFIFPIIYGLFSFLAYQFWHYFMGNPSVTSVVPSKRSFTIEYISVISGWFVPLKIFPEVRVSLIIFIGLLFMVILVKRKIRILNIGFFFFFVSYLVGRSYYSNVDYHESERYLSLVYPFFLIGILVPILEWFYSFENILLKRIASIFSISLIVYTTIRSIWNDIIWF